MPILRRSRPEETLISPILFIWCGQTKYAPGSILLRGSHGTRRLSWTGFVLRKSDGIDMTRPKTPRFINNLPKINWFKPAGVRLQFLEEICLSLDEVEAIRLADLEGHYQEVVAEKMNVSRQTVGRILASAHKKIADALVLGKAIRLEGGEIVCQGNGYCCDKCQDDINSKCR